LLTIIKATFPTSEDAELMSTFSFDVLTVNRAANLKLNDFMKRQYSVEKTKRTKHTMPFLRT